MKCKAALLTALALVLTAALAAALLDLRPRPLSDCLPPLPAGGGDTVIVGYWPSANTSPFYDPLSGRLLRPEDRVIPLSVSAEALARWVGETEVRPRPFRRSWDPAYYREFFFTLSDGEGGTTAVILSSDGGVRRGGLTADGPAMEHYIGDPALYGHLNDLLTEAVRQGAFHP